MDKLSVLQSYLKIDQYEQQQAQPSHQLRMAREDNGAGPLVKVHQQNAVRPKPFVYHAVHLIRVNTINECKDKAML